jgi:PAS domain S-box-containing protein
MQPAAPTASSSASTRPAQRHDAILQAVHEAASILLRSTSWKNDITTILGRLGAVVPACRAFLLEIERGPDGAPQAIGRHEWTSDPAAAPLGERTEGRLTVADGALAQWETLGRGESIRGLVETLPATEREFFASLGVASIAMVPVFIDDTVWGALGVADQAADREWEAADVDALGLAATTLGGALARRRSEERLRESEERFRLLSDAAAEGVVIHDNGIIVDANLSLARMFGYEVDELLGRNAFETLPAPESLARIMEHVRSGSSERYEVQGRRKDGTLIDLELTGRPMMYRGRHLRVATFHDITERKRAEETARRLAEEEIRRSAAEESQRRTAFLAEASRVLGTSFDYQTTLSSLARLAVPEFADYCVVDVAAEDGTGIQRIGTAPLSPRSVVTVPLRVGERVLGVLALYWAETDRDYGPEDLALVEELARRASLAVDNARLFHEAQHATRARDEMLSVVAHDLRNPLNTIVMGANTIAELIPNATPLLQKHAGILRRAADRMNRLIQDLLDVKRIESGQLMVDLRSIAVSALIDEATEMLRPLAAAASLELLQEVAADLPRVQADSGRILQVLSNLVGNAIKFTPPGGRITMTAIDIGNEVRFEIADTGPGIAADQLPHVFGRFWQGSRGDRRGIGLGLAIAKGIVEAHGGRIWVESRVGEGSHFYFTLRRQS